MSDKYWSQWQDKLELKLEKLVLRASYIGYLLSSTKPLELVNGDALVVGSVLKEPNKVNIKSTIGYNFQQP